MRPRLKLRDSFLNLRKHTTEIRGTSPNPLIYTTTQGLDVNSHGCIVADEVGATSREGVFAGGDIVSGAATVILAMGAGKQAAKAIDEYLRKK